MNRLDQGREVDWPAHFPPPPDPPWPLDDLGRPYWLMTLPAAQACGWRWIAPPTEGSRGWITTLTVDPDVLLSQGDLKQAASEWAIASVRPPVHGPLAMPAAAMHGLASVTEVRGPSVEKRDPVTARVVAYHRDVLAETFAQLERFVRPPRSHGDPDRKKVGRYLDRGRALLCAEKVLPWAGWPDGQLPEHWWVTREFGQLLSAWYAIGHEMLPLIPRFAELAEQLRALDAEMRAAIEAPTASLAARLELVRAGHSLYGRPPRLRP